MRRTSIVALLTTTCALTPVVLGLTGTADAATQSSITGTAFTDSNRNGVLDTGETPRSGDVLYLFASDGQPGEAKGQAVGGVWWVVGADGQKITTKPGASGNGYGY